jgi:cobaltochelatase CobS
MSNTIKAVDTTMQAVFGMGGTEPIRVFQGRARVPKINEHYAFTPALIKTLILWYKMGHDTGIGNLCIFGSHGAGKTEAIRQFAARIGVPVYEDIGSEDRVYADFIGMYLPTADGTKFQESMLLRSMRDPGSIYLLNEIDKMSPKTSSDLHNLLDTGTIENCYNGDVIAAAPGWRLAATANTNGSGDKSGQYIGTKPMNIATVSRFRWIKTDYLSEQSEVKILTSISEIPEIIAQQMVNFARATRAMYQDQAIRSLMTTREVIAWALLAKTVKTSPSINSLQGCLDMTFMSTLSVRDRDALSKTFQDIFGAPFVGMPTSN